MEHSVTIQLLEAINQEISEKRQRRQTELLKPYIAAQMENLPEKFTLGDEKNYEGFYNKPLSEDLSYRCFVLASLEDGDTVRSLRGERTVMMLNIPLPCGTICFQSKMGSVSFWFCWNYFSLRDMVKIGQGGPPICVTYQY